MRQIPTGQYVPGTSMIHKVDARIKILCLCVMIGLIVCANTVIGYGAIVLVLGVLCAMTRIPIQRILGTFRHLLWFFVTIFLMNSLFFGGEGMLWQWGIFSVSTAGIIQGLTVIVRVFLVLIASNLLMMTTSPMDFTGALQSLMKPLKYIGVPVDNIAMILSVAINFVPILMEETQMIRKAQTARGARFESKKLHEKAIDILPLIIPIFIAAFRRADELATAMEARGYGRKLNVNKKIVHEEYRQRIRARKVYEK